MPHPQTLFDCLGNPIEAWIIGGQCLSVAVQYHFIARKWKQAQIAISLRRKDNPYFWLRWVFYFCAFCGYLLTLTSLWDLPLSYHVRLASMALLIVANQWFLNSSVNRTFALAADDARVGRKTKNILEEVRAGKISRIEAIEELNRQIRGLLDEYK